MYDKANLDVICTKTKHLIEEYLEKTLIFTQLKTFVSLLKHQLKT